MYRVFCVYMERRLFDTYSIKRHARALSREHVAYKRWRCTWMGLVWIGPLRVSTFFFWDASVTGARYSNTARITHATAWYADWAGSDLPREFLLLGIVRVAEGVTDTTPKKGLLGLKKSR